MICQNIVEQKSIIKSEVRMSKTPMSSLLLLTGALSTTNPTKIQGKAGGIPGIKECITCKSFVKCPGMKHEHKVKKLWESMEPNSLLLLFSPEAALRNRDVHYPYRNSSDILYLTGMNRENIIMALEKKETRKKITLFVEPPVDLKIRWEGSMPSMEDYAGLFPAIDPSVRPIAQFSKKLPELLKNKDILYIDLGENSGRITQVLTSVSKLNINTRATNEGPKHLIDISAILHEMRLFKNPDEIQLMQEAAEITAAGFAEIMRPFKTPLYERDYKVTLEKIFYEKGASGLAYPSIVASGNNATFLHYHGSDRKVSPQDLVLIDAGAEFNYYASDVTRTFPAGGRFSPAQKRIYSIVLDAQKQAIEQCTLHYTLEDIHRKVVESMVAQLWELGLFAKIPDPSSKTGALLSPSSMQEVLDKKYFRHYYMHYTSHYIGLDVHDVGKYHTKGVQRDLEPGMVITIEPGLYFPEEYDFIPKEYRGIGIRIEDDILIDDNSPVNLTKKIPKEIDDIQNCF